MLEAQIVETDSHALKEISGQEGGWSLRRWTGWDEGAVGSSGEQWGAGEKSQR